MSKSCRTAIDKSFCAMAVKEQLTTLNLKHDTMKVCQQCEYSLVRTIHFQILIDLIWQIRSIQVMLSLHLLILGFLLLFSALPSSTAQHDIKENNIRRMSPGEQPNHLLAKQAAGAGRCPQVCCRRCPGNVVNCSVVHGLTSPHLPLLHII